MEPFVGKSGSPPGVPTASASPARQRSTGGHPKGAVLDSDKDCGRSNNSDGVLEE